jgi:hypothetical protein
MKSETSPAMPSSSSMQLSRRTLGIVVIALVLAAMVLSVVFRSGPLSGPYRQVNAARPSFDPSYRWPTGMTVKVITLHDVTTAGNRVWISVGTAPPGKPQMLLIDTDKREVIGRLHDAAPECLSDRGRLVCSTSEETAAGLLSHTIGRLPNPLNLGHVPAESLREEFWLLDIGDPAVRVPLAHVFTADPKRWRRWSTASPKARLFLTDEPLSHRRLSIQRAGALAIDLERKATWRLTNGQQMGTAWLDESTVANIGAYHHIHAENVISGTGTPLRSGIRNFLRRNRLPAPDHLVPRAVPGTNAFFFSDSLSRDSNWLAVYVPATSNLTLLSRTVPSGFGPAYNSHGTHCLYHRDYGSAYVYELASGKSATVLTPDSSRISQLSILKSNRVIYVGTNGLESCDFDGQDRRRLFPPEP